MRVNISFPKCRICGNETMKSFHKDCPKGGNTPLEVDVDSEIVYCNSCGIHWKIFDSTYYCSRCNNVVDAKDILDDVKYTIDLAKLVIKQIQYNNITNKKIKIVSDRSFFEYVTDFLSRLGVISGYASGLVTQVITLIKKFLQL